MFADHILRKTKFFHDSLLLYTNLSSFLLWLYVFLFAPSYSPSVLPSLVFLRLPLFSSLSIDLSVNRTRNITVYYPV